MPGLVCLDTNISGWVFRDDAPPEDPIMRQNYEQSHRLVKVLQRSGYQIMLPSVVFAELLCVFPPDVQNAKYAELMSLNIHVTNFDVATAMQLSRILYRRYYDQGRSYRDFTTKQHMKYDSMILAMAIEHGAECFYTTDHDFHNYDIEDIEILGPFESPPSATIGGLFEEE